MSLRLQLVTLMASQLRPILSVCDPDECPYLAVRGGCGREDARRLVGRVLRDELPAEGARDDGRAQARERRCERSVDARKASMLQLDPEALNAIVCAHQG